MKISRAYQQLIPSDASVLAPRVDGLEVSVSADIADLSSYKAETTTQLALKANQVDLISFNNAVTQKADMDYVDTKIQGISLAYKESYATLPALQAAYPSGDINNHSVLADGFIYTYVNSAWVSTGIQANGTGVANSSITLPKLGSDVTTKMDMYKSILATRGNIEALINKYSLLDGSSTVLGNTARFLPMEKIPANYHITNVKVYCTINTTATIELWSIGTTNLERYFAKTVSLVPGVNIISLEVDVDQNFESYISVYTTGNSIRYVDSTPTKTVYVYRFTTYADTITSLPVADLVVSNNQVTFNICIDLYGYNLSAIPAKSVSWPQLSDATNARIDTIETAANNVYSNKGQLEAVIDKYSLLDGGSEVVGSTGRIIPMKVIKKHAYLESLKVQCTTSITLTVELWSIGTTNLERYFAKTVSLVPGVNIISLEVDVMADSYISIYSASSGIRYITASSYSSYVYRFSSYANSLTELPISVLTSNTNWLFFDMCIDLMGYDYNLAFKPNIPLTSLLTVGPTGCDYTTPQAAIEGCGDSASNPVTIEILPSPTPYPRLSMVQQGADVNSLSAPSSYHTRYISLIGRNKHDCIIKDDSGEYLTPPAEIVTNGLIKNLTFIATHDNPPATRENAKHKAYAVHSDFGTENVVYEDCDFISYQAPALGIGLAQDKIMKFKNCDFYSYGPTYDPSGDPNDYQTNYSYLTNYGALFCHSNPNDNVTNQHLILDNCRFYSQNGDRGLWISIAGNFVNCNMTVTAINCMAISLVDGSSKVIMDGRITLSKDSYGNNDSVLNA